jgi:nucleotide-binding universal stress UspA family protein
VLGGTVHEVMRDSEGDVVVLIDRGLPWPPARILVPFAGTAHDRAALRLAARLAERLGAELTVLNVMRPGAPGPPVPVGVRSDVRVVESSSPVDAVIAEAGRHDLTVLGVGEGWQLEPQAFGLRSERLASECPSSLLVVRGRAETGSDAR